MERHEVALAQRVRRDRDAEVAAQHAAEELRGHVYIYIYVTCIYIYIYIYIYI